MIKIIEGSTVREVCEAVLEGRDVAVLTEGKWRPVTTPRRITMGQMMHGDVGIVDDTAPTIDWDGFDYPFFDPYGGLFIENPRSGSVFSINKRPGPDDGIPFKLVESPFYYWPGGECPVPGDVEVEVKWWFNGERDGATVQAITVDWNDPSVFAFRLTGRVL